MHELFLFAKIIYSSRSKAWLNKKLTVLTDGFWAGPGFAQGLAELLKEVKANKIKKLFNEELFGKF